MKDVAKGLERLKQAQADCVFGIDYLDAMIKVAGWLDIDAHELKEHKSAIERKLEAMNTIRERIEVTMN